MAHPPVQALDTFSVQNWAITAVEAPVEPVLPVFGLPLWHLTLSGVILTDFRATDHRTDLSWSSVTFSFEPDASSPMNWAIETYNIAPPEPQYQLGFEVQQWAVYVSPCWSGGTDWNSTCGVGVTNWQLTFSEAYDFGTHERLRIYSGTTAQVAYLGRYEELDGLNFNITMAGWIHFLGSSPIVGPPPLGNGLSV